MSNIKNYNALQDSVIWSKDGTNNIQLNNDATSSSIQLNRDLNTVPIATTLNPTGVSNGGFTTNWDRIARVQQAFSAVELPDNATELKVNNSVYVNSSTDSNVIFDKAPNTTNTPYPNNESEFQTRLSKKTDKNVELGLLNNEVNIVKNITPDFNNITANVATITNNLNVASADINNTWFALFNSNQKSITGLATTAKQFRIQNFGDSNFTTIDISSITPPANISAVWATSLIRGCKTYSYTSATNADFVLTISSSTNSFVYLIRCQGDPTNLASYTISTNYLSTGVSILTPQSNGTALVMTPIANAAVFMQGNTSPSLMNIDNDLILWSNVTGTIANLGYVFTNFNMTQACYYSGYNLGALSLASSAFISCNSSTGTISTIFTNNTNNTIYLQNIHWDKITNILTQSQLLNISVLYNIGNISVYTRNSGANGELYNHIQDDILYTFYGLYTWDTTVPDVYTLRILRTSLSLTNLNSIPVLEKSNIMILNTSITQGVIDAKPISFKIYNKDSLNVYFPNGQRLYLTQDCFDTQRSIDLSGQVLNYLIWLLTEQLGSVSAQRKSFQFPEIIYTVPASGVYNLTLQIVSSAPTVSPTNVGKINIANNNLSIEATNNLNLQCNTTGVGGTISLTGGTGIVSASAGSNSGQHLRIFINGTPYKINLFNDV